jgi:hypothetical protein
MNRMKFVPAIVLTLILVVMLAPGNRPAGAGSDRTQTQLGIAPIAQLPTATVSDPVGLANLVDVDVLELIGTPSAQQSPLTIRSDRQVQARGTVVPIELDAQQVELIRFEQALQLDAFPIPASRRGEQVRSVTLHLERMPVITNDTVFVLGDPDAPAGIGQQLPTPNVTMYRGTIDGEPDSRVFLSLTPETAYGYIRSENQTHLISHGPHGQEHELLIYNLTAMPAGAIPWRDFVCSTPPHFVDLTDQPGVGEAMASDDEDKLPCRRVTLAIDTDRQFTDNLFGGDLNAAGAYAATMVGAASEIYLNDLNSYFELSFLRLWTGSDIWTGGSTFMQLIEFREEWNANMSHIDRHLAHYLSGRNLGGGVAWLNAICHSSNGYALSANLGGFFPYPLQDNHEQNWDIVVFAHELGHNFGAPHTHDVCPPVDQCAPEAFHGQCQDETVCITDGTIMGYCHTCPGGLSNVVLSFHPTIRDIMRSFLDSIDSPSCELSTGTDTCIIGEGCEWIDLEGGTNNTVWALAEVNGELVAGGDFTSAGGLTAQRIARWDGEQWSSLGPANNTVRALAAYNGELVAGGLFSSIGGQVVNRIARYNGSQWQSLGTGVSGGQNPRVYDMTVFGGDLYVSGTFTTAGGETVNRIARWDGGMWHPLGSGMNNNVYALAVYNGQLHAAGSFTNAGGVAVNRIARWDGSEWHPLGAGMNNIVFALEVYGGDLIAGGLFNEAGGEPANFIAKWNGSSWQPLDTGVNDLVQALAVLEDHLYVGGNFAVAGSIITSRIAQWDGAEWSAVGAGVNNIVRAIIPYEDALAVGGSFTLVGGQPLRHVAIVDCDEGDDKNDCPRPADLNCDGVVDGADLLILLSNWGECAEPENCPGDITGDGVVDGADLLALLSDWG